MMSKASPEADLGALVISQVPALCQTGELQGGGADPALGGEGRCLKAPEPYRALTEEGERPPPGAQRQWDISHGVTPKDLQPPGWKRREQGPGSAPGVGTASCGGPLRRWFPDLPRPANQIGVLLLICISICMTTPLRSRRLATPPSAPPRPPPHFWPPVQDWRWRAGAGGCGAGWADLGCQPGRTIHSSGWRSSHTWRFSRLAGLRLPPLRAPLPLPPHRLLSLPLPPPLRPLCQSSGNLEVAQPTGGN